MISRADLAQFTGTQTWTRWSILFPHMVLTEGALYVAEEGRAYWLMDAIASYQLELLKHDWAKVAQFWHLAVDLEAHSAVLTCKQDDGYEPAVIQKIPFTDFDLPEIDLWVMPTGGPGGKTLYVILLPSEY